MLPTGYDASTDVLTDTGFVSWSHITRDHRLATFDPQTALLVGYESAQHLYACPYDGPLLHFPDTVGLLAAPDTSLYLSLSRTVQQRLQPSYSLMAASTVLPMGFRAATVADASLRLRRAGMGSAIWHDYTPFEGFDPIACAKLIGFTVGDGTARGGHQLQFTLRKERKIVYLQQLCAALPVVLKCRGEGVYTVNYPGIGRWTVAQLYTEDGSKRIPVEYLSASTDVIRALLDGLRQSDGSTRGRTWEYTTTSQVVADQLQALGALVDQPFSVCVVDRHSRTWRLHALRREHQPHVNDPRRPHSRIRHERHCGLVYNAATSTGLILVRRCGHTLLSGSVIDAGTRVPSE